jgi:phage terminase large subunit GpA-like protein
MARARAVHRPRELSYLGGVFVLTERDMGANRRRIRGGRARRRERAQDLVNTVLGLTWKGSGDAPAWERLYAPPGVRARHLPAGVLFLTAGVDVQKDRLVYEVVGWGRGKRTWSIDAAVIPGDTSDSTDKGPWSQLAALLDRTYPHENGVELRSP